MDYVLNLWVNLATDLYRVFGGWGLPGWAAQLIIDLIVIVFLVILGVMAVIVLTPMERKVIARIQNRIGPNRVGPWGIFQAIPDAIKMLTKEMILPHRADRLIYTAAPILMVMPALMIYAVLPFGQQRVRAAQAGNAAADDGDFHSFSSWSGGRGTGRAADGARVRRAVTDLPWRGLSGCCGECRRIGRPRCRRPKPGGSGSTQGG